MIRKIITALILVPFAIVFVTFAVANRQTVVVSFDPFDQVHPAFALALPLFALILALVIGGVMVGGVAAWLRQSKWRRAARLADAQARELSRRVRGRAQKVALSVDATDEQLAAIIDALLPDMLQLHGNESPDRVVMVRSRFGLPVMKALPIAERADLSPIRLYDKLADRLLFDARA